MDERQEALERVAAAAKRFLRDKNDRMAEIQQFVRPGTPFSPEWVELEAALHSLAAVEKRGSDIR